VIDLIERNPLNTPRYELVDGVLLVTPGPSYAHQSAVGRMYWLLANYFETQPGLGEVFMSPADVMPEQGTTVAPDVFVVPRDEGRRIRLGGPARNLMLVVEVLSPRDRSGDRGRKRRLYQRTIPEYWIVDTVAEQIELWRPGFNEALMHSERLEWHPAGSTVPFVMDIRAYFARVRGEGR
jgi:Uma2 family endonuclease